MAYIDYRDINRIKAKYYDPNDVISRISYRDRSTLMDFSFGIVEDNADPDKKGRLKVRFPLWGGAITSNWIPLLHPYSSEDSGIWTLPDIGTQVICCFFNANPSKPVVMGSVYTPRAKPPIKDNTGNNIKCLTTKGGSEIIVDDTKGEEKIIIHTKDGKMRLLLDKNKGLSIINENGDIKIKAREVKIESSDNANVKMKKSLSFVCQNQDLVLKARKSIQIKAGNEVNIQGQKIKLKGNLGVTAGGKQVARKDDQVLGIDTHDIQVPSNTGLVTVPGIPHIYAGKLADKLSDNVTVNDRPAAMKDSKSKFDAPGHFPMPPGVKFAKSPSNEGVVSSGTIGSVKINGKEAAVLGSKVKTCNDPQDQETCTIFSLGAAVPLRILVPGMDPEQFKKDGGFIVNTRNPLAPKNAPRPQDIQRSLQNPRWSSSQAKVGEEVTLSVDLTNQHENANVLFTIWEEGADTEKDQPVAKFSVNNRNGKALGKWKYVHVHDPEHPPKAKPKFVFTVNSYRCKEEKSGTIEWGQDLAIEVVNGFGEPVKNAKYILIGPDGKQEEGTLNDEGKIEKENLIPGTYRLKFAEES